MIKLITTVLTSFLLFSSSLNAQNMVARPADEAQRNPSLLAYRNAVLTTVRNQDTEAFLKFVHPEIILDFGGGTGRTEMRKRLNLSAKDLSEGYKSQARQMRQAYWDALEAVLTLGGRFDDTSFVAPYTWTARLPDNASPFNTYFVIGSNVLMRTSAHADAPVINRLSHNIVYIKDWQPDAEYQPIRLPDGQTGYLSRKYLRSLTDYRAFFQKIDGKWQMIMFIAGD